MKNILIANSSLENLSPLFSVFYEMKNNDYKFYCLNSKKTKQEYNCHQTKSFWGIEVNNNFNLIVFLFIFPAILFYNFLITLFLKVKYKISSVACIGWNEKIIMAIICRVLKIKCIYLELPNLDYQKKNSVFLMLYKFFSKKATFLVLTDSSFGKLLRLGIEESKIKKVTLGIKANNHQFQENIFEEIAKVETSDFHKRYFTIGTIADLDHPDYIEVLFNAIKTCLIVAPNIQLIVVGDGKERKRLVWLSKKHEIESLVWFVGEQNHLRKWLDGLDLYIPTCKNANLSDVLNVVKAMSAGLPILSFFDQGFNGIIENQYNGAIIESNQGESLSDEIIRFYRDRIMRKKMGLNSLVLVKEKYSLENTINQFISIL